MKKRTFEDSVQTLKRMRDTYHSQLDISVMTELNTVIADLEEVSDEPETERKQAIGLRALQVIGVVVSLVSNLRDLMK